MKELLSYGFAASVSLTYACMGFANSNPITVDYLSGTTEFSAGGNGSAYYVASVNPSIISPSISLLLHVTSTKSSSGLLAEQIISGSAPPACAGLSLCTNNFLLNGGGSCCLAFSLTGNIVGNYTMQPLVQSIPPAFSGQATAPLSITVKTAHPDTTSLSTDTSKLALSVNCTTSSCPTTYNAALTGNARAITITNTGPIAVTGLSVNYPKFPKNTQHTTTCGSTLPAGGTCLITIIPGDTATPGEGGVSCAAGMAPSPGTIHISADNAASISSEVEVLTYGCIHQGGYIYAIDDTINNGIAGQCTSPPCTGSIGGKVAAESDQAQAYVSSEPQLSSIIWGATSTGSYDGGISIWGIDETSTSTNPNPNASSAYPAKKYTQQQDCNGNIDGECNTNNIFSYYSTTAPVTALSYYATGLCKAITDPYADWYLPAVCEMGPASNGSGCLVGEQNMLENLPFLLGDPTQITPGTSCTHGSHCLAGYYWSSTEWSIYPMISAWFQYFSSDDASQNFQTKSMQMGVRCSRSFHNTP